MEETREMELKPGAPIWQWAVLVILCIVVISVVSQGVWFIIKDHSEQSIYSSSPPPEPPSKLVGTWVIPGQKGNLILQSDGSGFSSSGYTNPDPVKWEEGDPRTTITPTNVTKNSDLQVPIYVQLTVDDNLLVFDSARAKSPISIMVRQK